MARKNYEVSAEEFCSIWQSSSSADEVAERLRMPKPIVLARASNYRSLGVKLKAMKRGRRHALDVKRLNELIQADEDAAEPASRPTPRLSDDQAAGVVADVLERLKKK